MLTLSNKHMLFCFNANVLHTSLESPPTAAMCGNGLHDEAGPLDAGCSPFLLLPIFVHQ